MSGLHRDEFYARTFAPRRRGTIGLLGDSSGCTPGGAGGYGGYSLYQSLTQNTQATLTQCLTNYASNAGVNVAGAVGLMSNLGGAAFNSLQALGAKNVGAAIGDATPLVAAALAASAADPLVGVAVIAGVGILSQIASVLFPPPSPQQCAYTLPAAPGAPYVCFQSPTRPSGPSDPTWLTIEAFDTQIGSGSGSSGAASWTLANGASQQAFASSTWAEAAFISWWPLVGMELYALGDRSVAAIDWANSIKNSGFGGTKDPDQYVQDNYLTPNAYTLALLGDTGKKFLVAFDLAFIKLQEIQLNGFNPLPMHLLVDAIVSAWNLGYSPCQTGDASCSQAEKAQYQLTPNSAFGSGGTFIEWVLDGLLNQPDNTRYYPGPIINIGPLNKIQIIPGGGIKVSGPKLPVAKGSGSPSTSSSSSALLVVGGIALVSVGGLYLYGRSHGMTLGETTRSAWSSVKRPFQRSKRSVRRR